MSSIVSVEHAFSLFHRAIMRQDFGKSHNFHLRQEQGLLPLIRTFLLGYYGSRSKPEQWSKLSGCDSGWGRIDFIIGKTAVEVAVRGRKKPASKLLPSCNRDETRKLLKHDGPAVLVLLDLGEDAIAESSIRKYLNCASVGRGPHKLSPYYVLYISPKSRALRFKVKPKRPLSKGAN